jgi:alpha-L-fucosidase
MNLYFESVGRGASFLLNVPPDRRGRIYETDAASLRSFGDLLRQTFAVNLASHAKVKASNVRRNHPEYRAENLLDGNHDTYWSTDDSITTPEVVFEFGQLVAFQLVRLRENIRLGQRISAFAIDTWQNGRWTLFSEGTSIGSCRILRSDQLVRASRVRLRITQSPVCPALSEFALFREAPG